MSNKEIKGNNQKEVEGIIGDVVSRTTKTPEEKKSVVYDNQPLDANGKPYKNDPKRKHTSIKNNVSKAGKASGNKFGWDMTGRRYLHKELFEEIPEYQVKALGERIMQKTPRRIASRALGLAENLVEYWVDRGLHYTDEVKTPEGVLQKKIYIKDLILISEAELEETARAAIVNAMEKGSAKVAREFLENQREELEQRFNDRAEYRKIAQDMGLSKKEYIWCLNVLNGVTQQQASLNVGWTKNMNMYHYRMNPAVKEFIAVVKQSRRQELLDSVPFSKETAQASIQFALGTLIEELEKPNNSKQDIINIVKEIRNTGETMGKATYLFPKEEVQNSTTNIAILAGENTSAVLNMLGQKHNTQPLNITQFADVDSSKTATADTSSNGGAVETVEGAVSE